MFYFCCYIFAFNVENCETEGQQAASTTCLCHSKCSVVFHCCVIFTNFLGKCHNFGAAVEGSLDRIYGFITALLVMVAVGCGIQAYGLTAGRETTGTGRKHHNSSEMNTYEHFRDIF